MNRSSPRRHPWRNLARAFSWHRRKLAVVAAVAAVLTGISAVNPAAPPTLAVVRATAQLAGGRVIGVGDVELAAVAVADAPTGAATEVAEVVGQRLAAPVPEGQVLTGLALISTRPAGSTGQVVAPLRLADSDVVALLRPGEVVDVVAADQQTAKAAVVARGVRVVTVPAVAADNGAQTGALVLVEVTLDEATAIARAAVAGALTVIWR